ncbi:MAG: imidazole glycerol phosphate synthase subunit HisH [Vicinamibacterales bacterium]
MIALIDYKAGNLTSVRKALAAVGAEFFTPEQASDLERARGIIVPGVGHFGATRALDATWVRRIHDHVADGKALLGICLGMQWLYESSEEAPDVPGLGLLNGACVRLRPAPELAVKVPHVGWNGLEMVRPDLIANAVTNHAQVYFTHSYVAPINRDTVATTTHGETFASVAQRGRVAGVQFHPEKSGDVGLQFLRNFLQMVG